MSGASSSVEAVVRAALRSVLNVGLNTNAAHVGSSNERSTARTSDLSKITAFEFPTFYSHMNARGAER